MLKSVFSQQGCRALTSSFARLSCYNAFSKPLCPSLFIVSINYDDDDDGNVDDNDDDDDELGNF